MNYKYFKQKIITPQESYENYKRKKQRKMPKSPLKKCCIVLYGPKLFVVS